MDFLNWRSARIPASRSQSNCKIPVYGSKNGKAVSWEARPVFPENEKVFPTIGIRRKHAPITKRSNWQKKKPRQRARLYMKGMD